MTSSEGDLRSRRRSATAREIHEATLRLAARHGYDHVTVDMISTEAGVSRRTFFNYYPSKEAAVVAGPKSLPEPALSVFLAGPSDGPAQVLRDLNELLLRELEQNQPARDDLRQVMALAQEHPAILAHLLGNFDAFERVVAAAVAQRLGAEPDDEVPALLAALALSTTRTGLQRWAHGPSLDTSPVSEVERTAALLHSLLIT
ncbi:TetR family transcriptional regulator [Kineosporia sp. J2-2]|uniref:TetR family transcriptional regulator n=1 Tax=Kineosporia corallincola TaxID=2835133 RepID=A0ABS5TSG2_9ACTN|nr:TetR/AcrR family transcriptional regulator [Kineosporia corallincola]MBT0773748.1 TetR family transcriptional regulator [Kineosporia corallincola]